MKTKQVVDKLVAENNQPDRLLKESPIPGYPEDNQATANAVWMVGDGQNPNAFFVRIGDKLIDEESGQASAGKTFDYNRVGVAQCRRGISIGQYAFESQAEQKFNDVILDESKGPLWVSIEDRQTGMLKLRFLRRRKNQVLKDTLWTWKRRGSECMSTKSVTDRLLEDAEPALVLTLRARAKKRGWKLETPDDNWFEAENPVGSFFFIYVNDDGTVTDPKGISIANGNERKLRFDFSGDPTQVAQKFIEQFSSW